MIYVITFEVKVCLSLGFCSFVWLIKLETVRNNNYYVLYMSGNKKEKTSSFILIKQLIIFTQAHKNTLFKDKTKSLRESRGLRSVLYMAVTWLSRQWIRCYSTGIHFSSLKRSHVDKFVDLCKIHLLILFWYWLS